MKELMTPVCSVDMIEAFITRCGGVQNAVFVLRRNVNNHRITERWLVGRKEFPVEVIAVMYGKLMTMPG
jgi:hypothetical protein